VNKQNWPLILIVGLHAILGIAFGLATPIFEAPDEANHFLFVRYLQVYHTLPVQGLDQNGPRAHHPPLYFVLGAALTAWVSDAGGAEHIQLPDNPDINFRYGDQANDHKTKFIHSADERWPYHGQALEAHVLRLLSTFFSALAVLFTYLMARQLFPARPAVAWLASALLAFNPMVLFMSGVVQNSTSALASSAFLLYMLSRWLRRGFTPARWAWLGVIFSAAVLFQVSGLTLAAAVGLALLYDAWRLSQPPRLTSRPFWVTLIKNGLTFSAPVLVLTGWWFVRNQILYGDFTANSIVAALWSDQPIMPVPQVINLLLTGMVGRFGFGLIVQYADWIYQLTYLLTVLAFLGLLRLAWTRWRARPQAWDLESATLWGVHAATVLAVTAGLIYYIVFFIRGGHGRYMFTCYPSLAVLLAAGGLAWLKPRLHWPAALAGGGLSLALSLYGLVALIIPTYAVPPTPTQAEIQRLTPVDASIGDTARVLGYAVSASSVKPGQELDVMVDWQILSQTDVPYTIFVHLYDPATGPVAQVDTYPGQGNYVTTTWDVGRTFVETYRLHVPPTAPALPQARILVGLYDAATMQRLPVTGRNAGPAEAAWVELGHLQIQP
jgi:4-amino-4-deoxy-L-arabinose transferase-like glycosyltransferase